MPNVNEKKQSDVLFSPDGNPIPYLACTTADATGYPPVFLDNSDSDYFLTMGNPNLLTSLLSLEHHTLDHLVHNLTIETPLQLGGDVRTNLQNIQNRISSTISGYPVPWALFTRDKKYIFGAHIDNFMTCLEDEKQAYQFTVVVQTFDTLIKIRGRNFDGRLGIDMAQGVSMILDQRTYRALFNENQIGPAHLAHFEFTRLALIQQAPVSVDYLAGMWSREKAIKGHTAHGQPSLGIFGIQSLSLLFKQRDIPRIFYDGKMVLPVKYGVSSAVAFIGRSGCMSINNLEAHKMGEIYSISAVDK